MARLVSPILVPGDSPTEHEAAGGDREATPRWRVWLCTRRVVSSLPAYPPAAGPGACSCSAASARPVATCATTAGRAGRV